MFKLLWHMYMCEDEILQFKINIYLYLYFYTGPARSTQGLTYLLWIIVYIDQSRTIPSYCVHSNRSDAPDV